jgi:NADH dehydrogenase [ubiquinone] 1 alpha subcomplex assembly factor 1
MGGISTSYLSLNDEKNLIFSGNLSLANNGGFASTRMRLDQDLNGIKAIKIRLKGDGNTYKLRFRQYNTRASYSSNFKSFRNKWTEVIIPIQDFKPMWRGYSYTNSPEINIDNIYSLGLQISDKQEGEFQLEIKYIKGIY